MCRQSSPCAVTPLWRAASSRLIAAGQEDDFIDPKGALPIISQRTLCIVVDTYQLGLVESREILEKCGKVAVIDHHRKGVGFIEKADSSATSLCILGQ